MQKGIYSIIKSYILNHPVTSLLLLVNTIMVLMVLITGRFDTVTLVKLGGIVPALVKVEGEYYRLVAAMFLHGSIFHFLMNGLVLFYIGGFVERYLGYLKFFILYMVSGIVSSLVVTYFGPSNVLTIGASGALYGVIGALFILITIKPTWFPPQASRSIRTLIIVNLILTFVVPSISIEGHLSGLIAGSLLIFLLIPKYPYFIKKDPRMRRFIKEENEHFDA